MERAEAQRQPLLQGVQRIIHAHALCFIGTAHELHARALPQVDGWDGDHEDTSWRNACTKRTPAWEDFSGWNCTPSTLPRRTEAGNRSPSWVVQPTTSRDSTARQTKLCA